MRFLAVIAMLLAFVPAASAEVSISIGLDSYDVSMRTLRYECDDGQAFLVQYITSETNALALLPVEGDRRVFVNVVSASGARYMSGQYEWWTAGEHATLSDLIKDKPLLQCKSPSE
ncbi:MliC family protein (plasmid) [Thioclava sp. 'Guangxiensis']|uniref:MliC family protein n=1 Tax=Thioclava sp. 'Guangxiensis' TaxID=3149044 RepID=UPI0032C41708